MLYVNKMLNSGMTMLIRPILRALACWRQAPGCQERSRGSSWRFRLTLKCYSLLLAAVLSVSFIPGETFARDTQTESIGRLQAHIDGRILQIYTYRPPGCAKPSILIVFHGNGRGAQSYLKSARDFADRGCFVVYSPLFDKDRFPSWAYHRGGLVQDGKLLAQEDWTINIVDDLVEWARNQEGRPEAASFLFGHSAGGQFLSRVAAYALPEDVERIIIANPSTYVLPSISEDAPYGYGGLPQPEADEWMRAYLAAPITIFLGSEDTGKKDLTRNAQANRQGNNRLDRGKRTFDAAQRTAKEHGWPFNWRLIEADDVGHSGRGMLTAAELIEALGF